MAIYRGTGGANEATDLATNQAVIAKQFAEDAANSATQANLTLDAFQDIYLGAFATAPTLDNDGNALQVGALYFSTATNQLFIRNATSWQLTATATPASFTRNSFTGNGTQTVFTLTVPPASNESVIVYLNGSYTKAYSISGTTLTFTLAPGVGIAIEVLIATTVSAAMLGNDSVFTAAIQNNAVTSQKIADAAITTTQLADNSVTTAKVVDANITTAKIADLNVTTAKLSDNAVTTAKVSDANITLAKLASNSVDASKIVDGSVGTAEIADSAVTLVKLAPAVSGQIGITGDKNRVINGSCQIVNVATFVATNNTAGYGGPEMFFSSNLGAGGQFTQSQQTLTFGGISLSTIRQTVNTAISNSTAGNYWHGITQFLEGFNVFDLRGKPVTVSFVFNTNLTGVYSVALRDGAGSQSYVSTINATANVPVQVSFPIPTIPLGASVPNTNAVGLQLSVGFINTGTFQTGTLNAWQSGNFVSATGATNWGATAGNFIELTNLQLEEGTVATAFVRRSYGHELALTQRYYQSSYPQGVDVQSLTNLTDGVTFVAINTADSGSGGVLPVPMRATPTFAYYSSAGGVGANTVRVGNGGASISVSLIGGTSKTLPRINGSLTGTGNVFTAHYTASARL